MKPRRVKTAQNPHRSKSVQFSQNSAVTGRLKSTRDLEMCNLVTATAMAGFLDYIIIQRNGANLVAAWSGARALSARTMDPGYESRLRHGYLSLVSLSVMC